MTNEQLAEFIQQGGNDELLPLLWDKTRNLIYMKCGQYWTIYSAKLERHGYTLDDFKQEGYNALLLAVKGFESAKGYKFNSYLDYSLKRVIHGILRGNSDILNRAGTQSLNEPLGESSNGEPLTVEGIVPDKRAAAVYEDIERLDEYNPLYEAVDSLPDIERSVIIEHYFKGFSFVKIGRVHGFTKSRAYQAHKRAIQLLRRGRIGRNLFEVYGNEYKCSFNGSIRVAKIPRGRKKL